MSAYLRSWLSGTTAPAAPPLPAMQLHVSPPPSDDDDDDRDDDADDDTPPAFPAPFSAQRLAAPAPALPAFLTDAQRMPPPPPPTALRVPGVPPPAPASTRGATLHAPSTTKPPRPAGAKRRAKVALAPGCGPLDWAALKASGADLRGVPALQRVTPSMLRQHNTKDDAWTAFHGRVYNVGAYLPFHPGGARELLRVAGRDGTALFAATHAWVSVDFMLDACMVGFLVPEPSSAA